MAPSHASVERMRAAVAVAAEFEPEPACEGAAEGDGIGRAEGRKNRRLPQHRARVVWLLVLTASYQQVQKYAQPLQQHWMSHG